MSNRYKGAVISATPPSTTGGSSGVASGAWTLEQQMQLRAAGLWPTQPPPPNIEDVFSTWLYTGNGSTQTITNGINLSTKGGLVWTKARSAADDSRLFDTSSNSILSSSLTNAKLNGANALVPTYVTFNTNGFYTPNDFGGWNTNGTTYASWTFREQQKFFDIVTYTGNGVAGRTIAHNLGSVPGCIIVKCTSASSFWPVYHRSTGGTHVGLLEATSSFSASSAYWNNTDPTSTVFTVGGASAVNDSGQTFVAYIFAHNAGGFGLTGSDNVISCGSFTSSSIGLATVDLGYEPQWLMYKASSAATNWSIVDNMRGFVAGAANVGTKYLNANSSAAELDTAPVGITSTGFTYDSAANITFIYIAIRRGPMAVPTVGTSVFSPNIATGNGVSNTLTTNFPVDLSIDKLRNASGGTWFIDRLRGGTQYLTSTTTAAEGTYGSNLIGFGSNTSIVDANNGMGVNDYVDWAFRRAPSFFDEVCYTGTGSATTVTHNLTVAPQMMIIKRRSSGADWTVYHVAMGASKYTFLDGSTELSSATIWNATTPTASVFSVGPEYYVNAAASTYVAYLFATCAGVSKVGSYTGTGALQTVDCGFTTGARFVLIHRIDSGSNNWFVYDSARGISSGDDPYLALNSTAAEVTGTNYVDTTSTGFQVTAAAPSGLNANGGTYIFLAIA